MKAFRFSAGSRDGPRSLVWWVTADKGEVYVGAREIRWWKASLHRSGAWHLRAHKGTPENVTLPDDRVFARWRRPEEMFPRLTVGVSIVIPHESITEHKPCRKEVTWRALPGAGQAAVFSVMLGAPRTQAQVEKDDAERGIEIIGEVQVDADRRAWVLNWIVDQDEHERELWANVAADEARGESPALWRFDLPDGREKIVVNGENRTARASRYFAELIVPR